MIGREQSECPLEPRWRERLIDGERRDVVASRWLDLSREPRRERSSAPADRYVLGLSLRATRLRFSRGRSILAEGRMAAGMLHVTAPGQALEAEFFDPCDFVHFYVAADYVAERAASLGVSAESLADLHARDPMAVPLGRSLVDGSRSGSDQCYLESVGQTILSRLLTARRPAQTVSPLPKWRLRRVQDYIEANIEDRITLQHLAAAAGLSRMHFAAQFRAAVGCRPHDYLLQQRVEFAKAAMTDGDMGLAEVALSAGFQTQSHFSTVFKRITGDTPGQWRRTNTRLLASVTGFELSCAA